MIRGQHRSFVLRLARAVGRRGERRRNPSDLAIFFIRAIRAIRGRLLLLHSCGFVVKSERERWALFQKQIHPLEIDDGLALVQRVDAQNPADPRAALPQCEAR